MGFSPKRNAVLQRERPTSFLLSNDKLTQLNNEIDVLYAREGNPHKVLRSSGDLFLRDFVSE